jgi:hypothetical protein
MKALFKAVVFALSLLASPSFADPIPEPERAAIAERVLAFDAAFKGGDMAAVFDFTPTKIISSLASQSGISEDQLKSIAAEGMTVALETVSIDDFGMDMETATWHATPDGSRNYALIPTFTVMTVQGSDTIRTEGDTLAFADGGTWFLVRADDPGQVELLTMVYPEFTGVTFAPATSQAVE